MKSRFVSHDVEALLTLGISYQAGRVLCGSVKLGLFDELERKDLSATVLARRLAVSRQALLRILRVLVSMKLLKKTARGYRNTPIANRYLCTTAQYYLGDVLRHCESLSDQWSHLEKALKTDSMVPPSSKRLKDYHGQLKLFLRAMDALGRIKSELMLTKVAIGQCGTMLDIGGGIGTYSVSFARANRKLHSTVYDLEPVIAHARPYIAMSGMHKRITAVAGECVHDVLPQGPFDLVLISNLLHVYNRSDCKKIIRKAVKRLAPQGTLIIHDYIFGHGDALAVALFDMTMFVGTPQGRCHERSDVAGWMQSAGIGQIKHADVLGGTAIVWGHKKKTAN